MSTDSLKTWYDLVRRLGLGPDLRPFDPDEAWDAYVHASDDACEHAVTSGRLEAGLREERAEHDIAHLVDQLRLGSEAACGELPQESRAHQPAPAGGVLGRRRAGILAALAELDPADRDVLVQRVFEARDFAAIAESQGCDRDVARRLYANALSKLQALLSRASPSRSLPASSRSPAADGLLDAYEKRAILGALQQTGGDRSAASRLLGVGKSTLYRKLKFHGLA